LYVQGHIKAWSVFLVVIGPRWLTSTDQHGNPQLLKPTDPLRQTLSKALAMPHVLVMPVLAEGTAMPAFLDLPELQWRNAAFIRRDVELHQDIDRIVRSIRAFWPVRKRFTYPRFACIQIFVSFGTLILNTLFLVIITAVPIASDTIFTLIHINFLFTISVIVPLFIGIWITTLILTIRLQRWGWFFLTLFLSWLGASLFFAFFGPVSKPKRNVRKARR
jgi:hypothetical protein